MKKQKPLILGHRGYRSRFPENTLLSFQKALEYGAGGFECDIQKTADNRFIVFHDPSLDGLTDRTGSVSGLTSIDVLKARVGGVEPVPILEELSSFPADVFINIEIKSDTIRTFDIPAILSILRKGFNRERLLISSFDPALLPSFRKNGFQTGLLAGERYRNKSIWVLITDLIRYRPRFLNLPIRLFQWKNPNQVIRFIRLLKWTGFRIAFWTVNKEEEFVLINQLADIVITDEVEKIVHLNRR